MNILDLFCGCGGLSLGFSKVFKEATFTGVDLDTMALDTYKNNIPNSTTICQDVGGLKESLDKQFDIVIGGAPCQGFSSAGKRDVTDPRNFLYREFVSYVRKYEPSVFLLENVPSFLSLGGGIFKKNILSDFELLGYNVVYFTLTASEYGVPQKRKRVFFVGTKGVHPLTLPNALTKPISVWEAISDLPANTLEDGCSYPHPPNSPYQEYMRENSAGVYNHLTANHSEFVVDTLSKIPDGGSYKDIPNWEERGIKYRKSWIRLSSKEPSPTITTSYNNLFHYKYNRIPTVRELARLQSFPDNFIFRGSKTKQMVQVGNAVPPMLSEILANQISACIFI